MKAQVVYFDEDPSRAVDPPNPSGPEHSPYQSNWVDSAAATAFAPAPTGGMPAVVDLAARPRAGDPLSPLFHSASYAGGESAQVRPASAEQPWPESVDAPPDYDHARAMQEAPWSCQLMPDGLFYRSYLAGVKEPRLGAQVVHEKNLGMQFDSTLGSRVGLIRFGNTDMSDPHGWQLDVEGAALLRQDFENELDVVATDFRVGVPLTYADGPYRMKLSYYHLSSHLGDEYMVRTGAARINFSRDVIVWGHALYVTPDWRIYFEAGYAFAYDDGAKPWEFQFGIEYSPACRTDFWGVPFVAFNAHLREEVDFGGNLVFEIGRQWRRDPYGATTRFGLFYYNGKSPQFEFFDDYEHQIGIGLWYDV
ncbi:MAG: DUF1207 domain-containing protein [Pirellulales bacterium]